MKNIKILGITLLLASCAVGPEYKKPEIKTTEQYQELGIKWQHAKPNADIDRGEWWKIFDDPELDNLIAKLNVNNQDIAIAAANYRQALTLVGKARSAYFPTISASNSITSQKTNEESNSTRANGKDTSSHSLGLSSSWEIDLWGSTRYTVASNIAQAQASKADLASQTLSAQSSLAQYYFELRGVDKIQELLDLSVEANRKILEYTKNNYKAGVMNESDVLNAENSFQNSKSSSYNNKITRAQYQHAIAVLVGESPSSFKLNPVKNYRDKNINIPVSIPSELLERRPDIAGAEELVKQANAKVGIAETAFFPSLALNSSFTMSGYGLGPLTSMPNFVWAIGPQATLDIIDFGARSAQKESAIASYEQTVASYRQTVLTAFSEVEDQLVSLNNLTKQVIALNKASQNSKKILNLNSKQYQVGTVDNKQVLNSKISCYNAEISAINTEILKRSSEISLIKALGGGWKRT
jgi:NodT family efflux transporter outer membrane factor (OMF) lipoprotein